MRYVKRNYCVRNCLGSDAIAVILPETSWKGRGMNNSNRNTVCVLRVFAALALLPFLVAAASITGRVAIHTDDGRLPASFVAANLSTPLACLGDAQPNTQCSAWMMDVTDDGIPDVVILDDAAIWVFTEKPVGKWLAVGQWSLEGACQKFRDTARAGQFQAITPVRPRWPDLEIAGTRFAFRETNTAPPPCPR
jgi:hypothetical protein